MDESLFKKRFPNAKGHYPEYKICCTECDDARYRLGFNIVKQVAHCFNCGFKIGPGRFQAFIGQEFGSYSKNDFASAESALDDLSYTSPTQQDFYPHVVPGIAMHSAKHTQAPWYKNLYALAHAYLGSRGFDPVLIAQRYQLLLPEERFFTNARLVIPTFEAGRMVFYQARTLTDAVPKYLNPPKKLGGIGKNNFVFNLDAVQPQHEIIICEGVFSAIAAGTQAVAVFGKEIGQAQRLKILQSGATRVVILFDPGALKSAAKAANFLRDALEVRVANLELGDPNEVDPSYLKKIIDNAVSVEDMELLGI